ncbi:hypothetical protein HDU97_003364 [Phlyctochytrium planicorne]|nr:hypothetical protein HDU97_003364 [Phlyctochytrium planicorne]
MLGGRSASKTPHMQPSASASSAAHPPSFQYYPTPPTAASPSPYAPPSTFPNNPYGYAFIVDPSVASPRKNLQQLREEEAALGAQVKDLENRMRAELQARNQAKAKLSASYSPSLPSSTSSSGSMNGTSAARLALDRERIEREIEEANARLKAMSYHSFDIQTRYREASERLRSAESSISASHYASLRSPTISTDDDRSPSNTSSTGRRRPPRDSNHPKLRPTVSMDHLQGSSTSSSGGRSSSRTREKSISPPIREAPTPRSESSTGGASSTSSSSTIRKDKDFSFIPPPLKDRTDPNGSASTGSRSKTTVTPKENAAQTYPRKMSVDLPSQAELMPPTNIPQTTDSNSKTLRRRKYFSMQNLMAAASGSSPDRKSVNASSISSASSSQGSPFRGLSTSGAKEMGTGAPQSLARLFQRGDSAASSSSERKSRKEDEDDDDVPLSVMQKAVAIEKTDSNAAASPSRRRGRKRSLSVTVKPVSALIQQQQQQQQGPPAINTRSISVTRGASWFGSLRRLPQQQPAEPDVVAVEKVAPKIDLEIPMLTPVMRAGEVVGVAEAAEGSETSGETQQQQVVEDVKGVPPVPVQKDLEVVERSVRSSPARRRRGGASATPSRGTPPRIHGGEVGVRGHVLGDAVVASPAEESSGNNDASTSSAGGNSLPVPAKDRRPRDSDAFSFMSSVSRIVPEDVKEARYNRGKRKDLMRKRLTRELGEDDELDVSALDEILGGDVEGEEEEVGVEEMERVKDETVEKLRRVLERRDVSVASLTVQLHDLLARLDASGASGTAPILSRQVVMLATRVRDKERELVNFEEKRKITEELLVASRLKGGECERRVKLLEGEVEGLRKEIVEMLQGRKGEMVVEGRGVGRKVSNGELGGGSTSGWKIRKSSGGKSLGMMFQTFANQQQQQQQQAQVQQVSPVQVPQQLGSTPGGTCWNCGGDGIALTGGVVEEIRRVAKDRERFEYLEGKVVEMNAENERLEECVRELEAALLKSQLASIAVGVDLDGTVIPGLATVPAADAADKGKAREVPVIASRDLVSNTSTAVASVRSEGSLVSASVSPDVLKQGKKDDSEHGQATVELLMDQVVSLTASLNSSKRQRDDLEGRLGEAVKAKEGAEKEVGGLKEELERVKGDVERMKVEVEESENRCREVERERVGLLGRLEGAEAELEIAKGMAAVAESGVKDERVRNGEMARELEVLRGRERELSVGVVEASGRAERVSEELKEVKERKEVLEQEVGRVREHALVLEGKLKDMENRTEEEKRRFERDVQELRRQVDEAKEMVENERRGNIVLLSQMETLRRSNGEMERRVREVGESARRLPDLEFRLASCLSELDSVKVAFEEEKGLLGVVRKELDEKTKELEELKGVLGGMQMEEVAKLSLGGDSDGVSIDLSSVAGPSTVSREMPVAMASTGRSESTGTTFSLVEKIQGELSTLRTQKTELLDDLDVLRKRVVELEGQLLEAGKRRDVDVEERNGVIAELRRKVDQAMKVGDVKEKEVREVGEALARVESELKAKIEEREKEVAGIREELGKVEVELKAKVEEREKEKRSFENALKVAGDEVTRVRGEGLEVRERLEKEKGELEGRLKKVEEEKVGLEDRLRGLEGEKGGLEERVKELEGFRSGVEGDLVGLREEKRGLEERVQLLVSESSALEALVGGLREEKSGLEERLKKVEEEKSSLRAEVAGMQEDSKDLNARLKQSDEQRLALENQISDARKSIDELKLKAESEVSALRAQADSEISALKEMSESDLLALQARSDQERKEASSRSEAQQRLMEEKLQELRRELEAEHESHRSVAMRELESTRGLAESAEEKFRSEKETLERQIDEARKSGEAALAEERAKWEREVEGQKKRLEEEFGEKMAVLVKELEAVKEKVAAAEEGKGEKAAEVERLKKEMEDVTLGYEARMKGEVERWELATKEHQQKVVEVEALHLSAVKDLENLRAMASAAEERCHEEKQALRGQVERVREEFQKILEEKVLAERKKMQELCDSETERVKKEFENLRGAMERDVKDERERIEEEALRIENVERELKDLIEALRKEKMEITMMASSSAAAASDAEAGQSRERSLVAAVDTRPSSEARGMQTDPSGQTNVPDIDSIHNIAEMAVQLSSLKRKLEEGDNQIKTLETFLESARKSLAEERENCSMAKRSAARFEELHRTVSQKCAETEQRMGQLRIQFEAEALQLKGKAEVSKGKAAKMEDAVAVLQNRVRDLELELTVDEGRGVHTLLAPGTEEIMPATPLTPGGSVLPLISPGDDGVIQMRSLQEASVEDGAVDEETVATRMRCLASGVRAMRAERDAARRKVSKLETEVEALKATLRGHEDVAGGTMREVEMLEARVTSIEGLAGHRLLEDQRALSSASTAVASSSSSLAVPDQSSRKRQDSFGSFISMASSGGSGSANAETQQQPKRDLREVLSQLSSRLGRLESVVAEREMLEMKVTSLAEALEQAEDALTVERGLLSAEMERTSLLVRDLQSFKRSLDEERAMRAKSGPERRGSIGSDISSHSASALGASSQAAELAQVKEQAQREMEFLRGEHRVEIASLERRVRVSAAEEMAQAVAAERERARLEHQGNVDGLIALHESQTEKLREELDLAYRKIETLERDVEGVVVESNKRQTMMEGQVKESESRRAAVEVELSNLLRRLVEREALEREKVRTYTHRIEMLESDLTSIRSKQHEMASSRFAAEEVSSQAQLRLGDLMARNIELVETIADLQDEIGRLRRVMVDAGLAVYSTGSGGGPKSGDRQSWQSV